MPVHTRGVGQLVGEHGDHRVPGTDAQRWYLHSRGRANTAGGDGALTRDQPTAAEPVDRPSEEALARTRALLRFILRRDRIRLTVWIVAIAGSVVMFAASLPQYYTEASERQARATLMENPGLRALAGPGYGLSDYTFGAMIAQEFLSWTAIFVALMSFLLVVRHTRAEEETGRAELVRAAIVGRHAHTAAALVVAGGASLVLGVLVAVGLGSLGLDSVGWAGSWLFGAALASIGLVFAATAAVTVQVSEYGRGAAGLAAAAFAVTYLVRGVGDMSQIGGGTLSWLSPIGWTQQTRVYVDNRWWPLLLALGLSVLLVAAAGSLARRRDLAAGLVPPRPGPATADRLLSSPLGLAWRLHRTSLAWWGAGLLLFGLAYGSLAAGAEPVSRGSSSAGRMKSMRPPQIRWNHGDAGSEIWRA